MMTPSEIDLMTESGAKEMLKVAMMQIKHLEKWIEDVSEQRNKYFSLYRDSLDKRIADLEEITKTAAV